MSAKLADLHALGRGAGSGGVAPPGLNAASERIMTVPRPRSRWRTRVLVPLSILLATLALLAYAARDVLLPAIPVYVAPVIPKAMAVDSPQTPPDAQAAAAPEGLGPVAVQAPGWIEPNPYAMNVPALTEGVVKEVLVLEGQRVEEGQVVVRMIDQDAALEVRAAAAVVAQREADIERARAAVAVAAAQLPVEAAMADELRDEISRKRELVRSGGVGAGEFRQLEIKLVGALARAAAAQKAVDAANAELVQSQSALVSVKVALDQAQLRLSRMEIRSPVAGVVLTRLVQPGTRMSMNEAPGEASISAGAVLRLYDPAHLQVRVDVPLADAAKVGVGTRAVMTTEALPDTSFSGTVVRAVHEANIQRNTVQFKISVDSPSPVLKPEMLMRVKLHSPATLGTQQHASAGGSEAGGNHEQMMLLIPAAAVTAAGDGKGFVWIIDATGAVPLARRRDVTVEAAGDEGFVNVRSGLSVSDRVIVNPPATLQAGTRLVVLGESPQTPAAPLVKP